MKRTLFLILVGLVLLAGLPAFAAVQITPEYAPASPPNEPAFYAIYDRLADDDSMAAHLTHAAMSGDGEKLIFATWDADTKTPRLYRVNADGSNLTQIPLPNLDERWIEEIIMDRDGSRAFLRAAKIPMGETTWLYKVEGGAATKMLQVTDHTDIDDAKIIQTTTNGAYVYFLDDGVNDNDVWRVEHNGGVPEKIIEDTDVINSGYPGALVSDFAISDDAGIIVFGLGGYWNGVFYGQPELFRKDAGGYEQLTTGSYWGHRHLFISGDGNTIIYGDQDTGKWTAMRPNGSDKRTLETLAYNFGGLGLTYDGSEMFYNDNLAHGGRLISTDGQERIDVFPESPIYIQVTQEADLSDDGRRVVFIYEYHTYPYKNALYIGHLNDPDAVPSAPTIHNITFTPPGMRRGDPNASIIVRSQISDQQGLEDIERTSTDEMIDHIHEGDLYKLPVYFRPVVHDDGVDPDSVARDGIFSTSGWPAGSIDTVDQMTLRVGAQDAGKTVVVADVILYISDWGGIPLFLPRISH